jgi:hypothetical protein
MSVLWHTTMSLDGFIAGPDHSMDWMSGVSFAPGTVDAAAASAGAILAGRRWNDAFAGNPDAAPYGGRFKGPIFVLTHHPEDATEHPGIRLLSCAASPCAWPVSTTGTRRGRPTCAIGSSRHRVSHSRI